MSKHVVSKVSTLLTLIRTVSTCKHGCICVSVTKHVYLQQSFTIKPLMTNSTRVGLHTMFGGSTLHCHCSVYINLISGGSNHCYFLFLFGIQQDNPDTLAFTNLMIPTWNAPVMEDFPAPV